MYASGPTIAPIVIGASGSRHCAGWKGGSSASTSSCSGTSISSMAWVSTKPSTHTITGTDSCSARAKACTCRSTASWLDSANSWTQPASRWDIASEWSFQMLMGAPSARLATVITIGSRSPEALGSASAMKSSPWLAVAV